MEANNHGCITEALTVAAMLSSETALLPGQRLVFFTFSIRLKKLLPLSKNMWLQYLSCSHIVTLS